MSENTQNKVEQLLDVLGQLRDAIQLRLMRINES